MTEIVIGALVLIVALAFFAFMDSSGQPEDKKEEGPQILDEDDFDE
jgi:nitrogen fixation-related uncharacterized protein